MNRYLRTMGVSSSDDPYQSIIASLRYLQASWFLNRLLRSFLILLAEVLALGLILILAQALFFLPVSPRLLLAKAYAVVVAALFALLLLFDFRRLPSLGRLALKLERCFPQLQDHLIAALAFREWVGGGREGYSCEMIEATVVKAQDQLQRVEIKRVLDRGPTNRWLRVVTLLLAGHLVVALCSPGRYGASLFAYLDPGGLLSEGEAPIVVVPGTISVPRGVDVRIAVRLLPTGQGRIIRPPVVRYKAATEWQEDSLRQDGPGAFTYVFSSIQETTSYQIRTPRSRSDIYTISVWERPSLVSLKVRLIYPGYVHLSPLDLPENTGDVTALVGTRVRVQAKATTEIRSATLAFSDSVKIPLHREGADVLSGSFAVRRAVTYHLEFENSIGDSGRSPGEFQVHPVADQYPTVAVGEPGSDSDVPSDLSVPLSVQATDDYGISQVRLVFRRSTQPSESSLVLARYAEPLPDAVSEYHWDVAPLGLSPGDTVCYYAEALDCDRVSGPKRATSPVYRLRFPTLEEIYKEVASEQSQEVQDLGRSLPEQAQLAQAIEQLSKELKNAKQLNWEEKESLNETVARQQDLARKVEETSAQIRKTIEKMHTRDALDEETLQRLEEVRRLLEEVATDEMRQALQKLRETLSRMDPKEVQRALKQLELSQDELKERLQRTITILKQVQREQQMEALTRRAEELLRKQGQVQDQTSAGDKREQVDLAGREAALKQQFEEMRQEMEELAAQMNGSDSAAAAALDSLGRGSERDRIAENMTHAIMSLTGGQKTEALSLQKEIVRGLGRLHQGLGRVQQALRSTRKKAIAESMRRRIKELVGISQEQESLNEKMKRAQNSPQVDPRQLAVAQQTLRHGAQRTTDDLYELARQTFFVGPAIGKALGTALAGMEQAQRNLEQANSVSAERSGGEAVTNLNLAALQLLQAQQEMMSAGSSGGVQETLEKMAGLSSQQQGVNEGTQSLLPLEGEGGSLSLEQRAMMARLAAEQEAIWQGVGEVQQTAGERSEILGRLDQLATEMEKVANDLRSQRINRETVERQERILSRLLDAQRSLTERDFREQRKAEVGKEQPNPPRPQQMPSSGVKTGQRDELLRALKEKYPPEFEALIRAYFETLSKDVGK